MESGVRSRGNLAFWAVFLLMGSALMGVGAYNIHKNVATPWEIAEGTVLHSEVRTHRSSDSTTYSPLVSYNYTYGGREYRGTHQTAGSSSDYDGARRLVDDHPPGRRVEVKVDPADPRESRLRLDFMAENFEWLVLMGAGSVFALPPVLVWKYGRSRRPDTPEASGPTGLPEFGTSHAVVECSSCHQLVEPVKKWSGKMKCPRCGARLG